MCHQRRDSYWQHGSVCDNFATWTVSGWHKYPHLGQPGPAIGFLQEVVRWWGRWLKDIDNDVMDEPMLRIWMQETVPPSTAYEERPGRWVGEPAWPSPHVHESVHPLARHRIGGPGERVEPEELTIHSPLSVGQFAGKWCSYSAPPDLPYDQREEDGGSLVFDTDPFTERCEILGASVLELSFASTAPVAMVAVRLSDVAPDGRATRISYGLLNLTHHKGHNEPELLEAGERDEVSLQPFDDPEGAPPIPVTQLHPGKETWTVSRDLVNYRSTLEVIKDLGVLRFDDIDLDVTKRAVERYSWIGDDTSSVRGETQWTISFTRGDWRVQTVSRTMLSSTATTFTYTLNSTPTRVPSGCTQPTGSE